MGKGFFLAGHAANACMNAISVSVSSEDALFPKANLQDGFLYSPFKFDEPALTDPTIEFDMSSMENGTFEADANGVSPPSFWRTLSGTPDVSTAQAHAGTKSMRLNAANEGAYRDRLVAAASTHRITAALYGDGTNAVNAYLIDMATGKYLTGAAAWTTTKTAWATKATTLFAVSSLTFTLESPLTGWVGPVRLRLLFERPGTVAGAAYVDSVAMWPKITVAALVVHTIPSAFPIAVESADDAAFTSNLTDHGDLPNAAFKTYLAFDGPATPQRYWRYAVTGTLLLQRLPTWVTQPVMGQRKEFIKSPRYGIVEARRMPKAGTDDQPSSLAIVERYRFGMSWRSNSTALHQIADEMVAGSLHGDQPVFAVPDVEQPRLVYGRGSGLAEIVATRPSFGLWNYSLSFDDDGSFVDVM